MPLSIRYGRSSTPRFQARPYTPLRHGAHSADADLRVVPGLFWDSTVQAHEYDGTAHYKCFTQPSWVCTGGSGPKFILIHVEMTKMDAFLDPVCTARIGLVRPSRLSEPKLKITDADPGESGEWRRKMCVSKIAAPKAVVYGLR